MFPRIFFLLFLLLLNKYYCCVSLTKGETAFLPNCNSLLEEYKRGNYNFQLGQHFEMFNSLMERKTIIKVQLIPGYDNCLGLLTSSNEAIVLKCHEKQHKASGCFKIITLTSTESNRPVSTNEENLVCVTELSEPFEHCVGLKIKGISTILLDCSIIPLSLVYLKNNGEPPRM